MACLNLSKQDLDQLRCCNCKGYLSIPPITITLDGFHCGKCVPQGEPMRLTIYEVLAKYTKFPCTYLGCDQQVTFGTTQNHESTCEFRTTNCPIETCQKVKTFKSMDTHLVADHEDLVIRTPKFIIPQKKEVDIYRVLNQEGMRLLLQIRTRFDDKSTSTGEFDLTLKYFAKPVTIAQYTYSLKITTTENNKSLTIDNHQIGAYEPDWNYPKQDVVSLDFNTLQMLLACNNFHFEVVLDKSQTKPNGAIKKTTNNNSKDNTRSEVVSKKEKTAASSGCAKEKKGDCSSFLDDLECIVCKEYMKPPIYICKTGHSICSVCKKSLSICPMCQANYEGARNFQLERLTDRLHQLTKTEPQAANNLICPLADQKCLWRGPLEYVYPHAKNVHTPFTWLKINQWMFLNINSPLKRVRLITEYDNRPFIVTIIVNVLGSEVLYKVEDFGLDQDADPLYDFFFYVYPDDEYESEVVASGSCDSVSPSRPDQQIDVELDQNKDRLYFKTLRPRNIGNCYKH